ncbi:hypothetical protein BVG19_g2380 [[Candida] boidinii]|nr:hypothetical protein BVG19_g2380 [[Candida] boidinii]OWB51376.1 hypothetical protein B5S27_g2936 [[Candida] boidinii]
MKIDLLKFSVFASLYSLVVANGDFKNFGAVRDEVNSIFTQADSVDSSFQQQGAKVSILQDYDSVLTHLIRISKTLSLDQVSDPAEINELIEKVNNRISKIYYRQGLINYSIGKDNVALEDYRSCLQYDAASSVCMNKLFQLGLNLGKIELLAEKLKDGKILLGHEFISDIEEKLSIVSSKKAEATQFSEKGDYLNCRTAIGEVLAASPQFQDARLIRIECLKNDKDINFDEKTDMLIDDYRSLLSTGGNSKNLSIYSDFFKLLYFDKQDTVDPLLSTKNLQICLRMDNEFEPCKLYAKLTYKLDFLFQKMNDISLFYSHVYFEAEDGATVDGDVERIAELEISDEKWREFNDFLFDESKKIKLRKKEINQVDIKYEKLTNNFEIFIELAIKNLVETFNFSNNDYELLYNSKVLNEFLKMSYESFIHSTNNYRKLKKDERFIKFSKSVYWKKFEALINKKIKEAKNGDDEQKKNFVNLKEKFIPFLVSRVDILISTKKYKEANEILSGVNEIAKKTKLWQSRYETLDKLYLHKLREEEEQRRRQHQFEHQQRQQQRQREQQQRYYEQQQQTQFNNDGKDLYEILDIPRDADDAAIKKAYREKVKLYHPDKNRDSKLTPEEIEAKMVEVNNAYEVLSDKGKRSDYDMSTSDNGGRGQGGFGGGQGGFGGGQGGFGGGHPFQQSNFNFNFGGNGGFGGFADMFGGAQGRPHGNGGSHFQQHRGQRRGP